MSSALHRLARARAIRSVAIVACLSIWASTSLAGERYAFSLHRDEAGELRLRVDKGERGAFVSPPLVGDATGDAAGEPLALRAEREPGELGAALALREVIQRRAELEQWVLRGSDGELLRLTAEGGRP